MNDLINYERGECEHGRLKRKCEICELTGELAAMKAERDSEQRWANQYKQERDEAIAAAECNHLAKVEAINERDEARKCLREAIDEVEWYESKTGGRTGLSHIKKWRKAAGLTASTQPAATCE